jgi:hypothetical protein
VEKLEPWTCSPILGGNHILGFCGLETSKACLGKWSFKKKKLKTNSISLRDVILNESFTTTQRSPQLEYI